MINEANIADDGPHRFRRLRAAALTKLFEREHGRAPQTLLEVEEWLPTSHAGDVDPFRVLTPEEIEAVIREED